MKCNIVTGSHFFIILFLIAVSLCTCRRSNEEYYFYSIFDRIIVDMLTYSLDITTNLGTCLVKTIDTALLYLLHILLVQPSHFHDGLHIHAYLL